jgi:hypothetical protein
VTLDMNGFSVVSGGGGLSTESACRARERQSERHHPRILDRDAANNSTQLLRVIGVIDRGTFSGFEAGGRAISSTVLGPGTTSWNPRDGWIIVINSVARGNTTFGLLVRAPRRIPLERPDGERWRRNAQVAGGGLQLGSNVCGTDLVCP